MSQTKYLHLISGFVSENNHHKISRVLKIFHTGMMNKTD